MACMYSVVPQTKKRAATSRTLQTCVCVKGPHTRVMRCLFEDMNQFSSRVALGPSNGYLFLQRCDLSALAPPACVKRAPESTQLTRFPAGAPCSGAVVRWHLRPHMGTARPRPGPDAVSAGSSGARHRPTLLQIDQDVLNKVVAKLEPEALAVAGAQKHSFCLHSSDQAGFSKA